MAAKEFSHCRLGKPRGMCVLICVSLYVCPYMCVLIQPKPRDTMDKYERKFLASKEFSHSRLGKPRGMKYLDTCTYMRTHT